MKRLVVFFLALGVIAMASTAHSGIRTEHNARAVFLLPERNGVRPLYFVTVTSMDAGAYVGFGILRGVCAPEQKPRCIATPKGSIVGELGEGDVFEIDQNLETAYLKVTRRGITHEVSWTTDDQLGPLTLPYDCGEDQVPDRAGVARTGSATATIFGHEMEVTSEDQADVSLSAAAFTC